MRDGLSKIRIARALHAAMMLERDRRRQWMQALALHQDFGAERGVRFDQLAFLLVERSRLLDHFERNLRLAHVVEQCGFDQRGQRRFVESHVLAEKQAQHRHVH